ncbi:MAG: hypothetical protein HOP09_01985 [Hyphomicrobium sp.]|nr:hypothetical protein [Hyphomicrobium sp.]
MASTASHTFVRDLERLELLAYAPVVGPEALARNLGKMYETVATAKFSDHDILAVRMAAPDIMYRLFDLRVGLRSRIADFEKRGFMSDTVVQGLRDVFRILRYVTDMLGEIAIGNARVAEADFALRPFTGKDRNTLVNWPFYNGKDLAFRSGDVVLVRGRAHNSAAIARIGSGDSQFSHTGIVYIDKDGGHWLVESLIEDGATINTLAHALDHGVVRAVLYRHKDADMAARAAELVHDMVQRSRGFGHRRIHYDFSMQLDDGRNFFCSKLVRYAFTKGSNGTCVLPRYPTQIAMKNRDFLDRIGVKAEMTYAPADIDIESAFDLVAEWQDYRETSNIRLQDFTMDKLFEWMERDGLHFEETTLVRLISRFGRMSSYLSDGAKQMLSGLFPRVPRNMPRRTVAAVAMLHQTAEPIYRELQETEATCVAETGRPLHGEEIFSLLEGLRSRDKDRVGYLVR